MKYNKMVINIQILRLLLHYPHCGVVIRWEDVNVKLNHIRLFACISGLVIICGICNYLTMLITRIRMRKRELALRKVNGSSNGGLLTLLLTELVLLLILSSGIGLVLIELILPTFKRLSQINEGVSLFLYRSICLYTIIDCRDSWFCISAYTIH